MRFGVNDLHSEELKDKARTLWAWIDSKKNATAMSLFLDIINALVKAERKAFKLEKQIDKLGYKNSRGFRY